MQHTSSSNSKPTESTLFADVVQHRREVGLEPVQALGDLGQSLLDVVESGVDRAAVLGDRFVDVRRLSVVQHRQEVLGVPVVSLRLTDPRYYHLDTALFVLDKGPRPQVAYYPEAFSPGSAQVLRRLFPDAVLGDSADAECLGLNAVSDGRNVVLPLEATGLAERLSARGYEPIMIDVSELRKSGGGPKCCTMELHG